MTILDFLPDTGLRIVGPGEFSLPCPVCGGTDRFHVWPDRTETKGGKPIRGRVPGVWFCRQCPEGHNSGDTLALLLAMNPGMKYPEAAQAVEYSKGGEKGRAYPFAKQNQKSPAEGKSDVFQPMPEREPGPQWQTGLAGWLASCQANLTLPECQTELQRRYLTTDQALALGLGWNPATEYRQAASLGIDGGAEKMKLPAGLVIPIQRKAGLHAVRIRRRQADLDAEQARLNEQAKAEGREPKKADKYWRLRGSGSGHCILGGNPALVLVCEAEIDAMRLSFLAKYKFTVLAIPAGGKPTLPEHDLLTQARRVLVALDADRAGQKGAAFFVNQYRHAVQVALPDGAGLGDLSDHDLQAWLKIALAKARPQEPKKAEPLSCPADKKTESESPCVDPRQGTLDQEKAKPYWAEFSRLFHCYCLKNSRRQVWEIYPGTEAKPGELQKALAWARENAVALGMEWQKIPGVSCTAEKIVLGA